MQFYPFACFLSVDIGFLVIAHLFLDISGALQRISIVVVMVIVFVVSALGVRSLLVYASTVDSLF